MNIISYSFLHRLSIDSDGESADPSGGSGNSSVTMTDLMTTVYDCTLLQFNLDEKLTGEVPSLAATSS